MNLMMGTNPAALPESQGCLLPLTLLNLHQVQSVMQQQLKQTSVVAAAVTVIICLLTLPAAVPVPFP